LLVETIAVYRTLYAFLHFIVEINVGGGWIVDVAVVEAGLGAMDLPPESVQFVGLCVRRDE
jgi:hypothetical protein